MQALIDLDNVAIELGAFGNYYGNLTVFKKGLDYSMSVANYSGHNPDPIPEYLFKALMRYADSVKDRDEFEGGVTIYDLNTVEGRTALEESY